MYKSCTWLVKKPRAEGSTAGIAVKTKPAKHDAAGIAPSFDTIETFPVGNGAQGLTFDGTNVWCANLLDDTVIKLRASDGVIEGTFPVGGQPRQREEPLTQFFFSCAESGSKCGHPTASESPGSAASGASAVFLPLAVWLWECFTYKNDYALQMHNSNA
jgi:hypothetical protein